MFLSGKYKKNRESNENQKATQRLIAHWVHIKKKVASYLQSKTERYSNSTKKAALIIFCLLFGGISVCLIITAFNKKNQPDLFSVHRIKIPLNENRQNTMNNEIIISKKEYEHLRQFKQKMDSLQLSNDGKNLYDSVMQVRPHLIDSIELIENLYQSQLNK